jgi:hypothetical protein
LASRDIGVFTPAQLKRVWSATLAYERTSKIPDRSNNEVPPDVILFRNDSGHEVPAYGCIQASGTVEEGYGNYLTIERPIQWTGAVVGPFLFNSDRAVPDGEFGVAQFGPIFRALDSQVDTLAVGTRVGPSVDSFKVRKGCLYTYLGEDDVATDCCRLIACETQLLGITDEVIPADDFGDATAKIPSATVWSAGSVVYTVHNPSSVDIEAGKLILMLPLDAKWAAVEIC